MRAERLQAHRFFSSGFDRVVSIGNLGFQCQAAVDFPNTQVFIEISNQKTDYDGAENEKRIHGHSRVILQGVAMKDRDGKVRQINT
ncbi:hypothetical protein D3C86_1965670 [compost metagenome]